MPGQDSGIIERNVALQNENVPFGSERYHITLLDLAAQREIIYYVARP